MLAITGYGEQVSDDELEYYRCTFIKVHDYGEFHYNDLSLNSIMEGSSTGSTSFEERLNETRYFPGNLVSAFDDLYGICC